MPRSIRASSFRLTVLDAAFPAAGIVRERQARAVGIGAVSVPGLAPVRIPSTGSLHAPCGTVAVSVGGHRVPLQPVGTVAALDAGRPLQARACTKTVPPPSASEWAPAYSGSGRSPVRSASIRCSSRSPAPSPGAPTGPGGRVVDPGHIGQSSVTGARVALNSPSWIVLGESFDSGWRATCDGRSLGAPRVVDGYGNGWLAPAGCNRVSFTFAPQSGVNKSYVVSAIVCALLLAFLLIGALRGPARASATALGGLLPDVPARPRPLLRAAALALPAAIVLGYAFSIRAGVGLLLGLTLVLWRGWRPATLALIAAGLLGVAVPITYLIVSPDNRQGDSFLYPTKLITAHWMGVAAITLMALAVWKIVRYVNRRA